MEQEQIPGVSLEVSVPNLHPELPLEIIPERYRCINCKKELADNEVQKNPLDFIKKQDGSLEPSMQRFSAFCKKCNNFIRIVDPGAKQQFNSLFPGHY